MNSKPQNRLEGDAMPASVTFYQRDSEAKLDF